MTSCYCPLPANWDACCKEIHTLLLSFYPPTKLCPNGYQDRTYLKPVFYLAPIKEHPETYPLLSRLTTKHQKRHISIFLKLQGRNPRSVTVGAERVWVHPEVVVSA